MDEGARGGGSSLGEPQLPEKSRAHPLRFVGIGVALFTTSQKPVLLQKVY